MTTQKLQSAYGPGREKKRYYVVDGAVFSSRKKAVEFIKERYDDYPSVDTFINVCYLDDPTPVVTYEVDGYTMQPDWWRGDPMAVMLDNGEEEREREAERKQRRHKR